MTTTDAARSRFTLSQLLAAVSGLLLLALVVPGATALWVNGGRVARAEGQAGRIAAAIRAYAASRGVAPAGLRSHPPSASEPSPADVLAGAGESPKSRGASRWLTGRTVPLAGRPAAYLAAEPGPDPWNNRFLVNIGSTRGPVWVLSAGPNGIVETPFDQAQPGRPGGDDVAVRIW